MPKQNSVSSGFLLKLALGVFFVILGINGLDASRSIAGQIAGFISKIFNGNGKELIRYIVAVIELLGGAMIILSLFTTMKSNLYEILTFSIFIFWIIKIIVIHILGDSLLGPSTLQWLKALSIDVVILVSIWRIRD